MSDDTPKFQSSVSLVLNLMKDAFTGGPFKTFYDGDPDAIPDFNLPALIVDQNKDDTDAGSFGQDDVQDEIVVKVVFNKKDDTDADRIKEVGTTKKRVRDIIAAREPETGHYLENTVKGALRKHITDDIVGLANTMQIEYGISPRPNGLWTTEGHVTFPIQYVVNVDSDVM